MDAPTFTTRHGTPVTVLTTDADRVTLRFTPADGEASSTQTIDVEFFDELVARGDLVVQR